MLLLLSHRHVKQDCASQYSSWRFKGLVRFRGHPVHWLPNPCILYWTLFSYDLQCHVSFKVCRHIKETDISLRRECTSWLWVYLHECVCVRTCVRCRGECVRWVSQRPALCPPMWLHNSSSKPSRSRARNEEITHTVLPFCFTGGKMRQRASSWVWGSSSRPQCTFLCLPNLLAVTIATASTHGHGAVTCQGQTHIRIFRASPWAAWMFECF